jgi:hypothetical protein
MKTTAIMIEFLVAGLLVLLALFLFALSFFPGEMQLFFDQIGKAQHLPDKAPFLIVIIISVAYGFGVLFEYIGVITFEWIHKIIKRKRIKDYYDSNEPILTNNPIFKNYNSNALNQNDKKKGSFHGEMRFYVLKENSALYSEIELQLNRLRLIRVLFFVTVILLAAVLGQLFLKFTVGKLMLSLFILMIAFFNVIAILHRFNQYCRAIERSFKMLNLKRLEENEKVQ